MNLTLMGWPNRCDTGVLSGGNWDVPLSNLQSSDLGRIARSADASNSSNTVINLDLGSANYAIKAISLHRHNLSEDSEIRVMLGTTSGGFDVYDSGTGNTYLIPYDDDIDQFPGAANVDIIRAINGLSARYVTIEITDVNNTEGYVTIGRLGVWSGYQTAKGPSFGAQFGARSLVKTAVTLSDREVSNTRLTKREVTVTYKTMSDAERSILYGTIRKIDTTEQVLFVPDTSDALRAEREGFLGKLKNLDKFQQTRYDNSSITFEIKEVV